MKIVEATQKDYEAANVLFKELDDYHISVDPERIRRYNECPRTEDEYEQYIVGDSSALFLCYKGEILAGMANVKHEVVEQDRFRVGREYILLDNLYVREECRRNGVGKALYTHVCGWAKNRNVTNLEIQVYANNQIAQQFYSRLGFKSFMLRMEGESNA